MKLKLLLLSILLAASTATAATYYVATTGNDTTGDGSSGTPWLTIQKAINSSTTGDAISVASGNYTEFVTVSNSVTIYGPAVFGGALVTSSSVVLSNLTLDADYRPSGNRLLDVSGSACRFENLFFQMRSNYWTIENTGSYNRYTYCSFTGGWATTAPGNIFDVHGASNRIELCLFTNVIDLDIVKVFGNRNTIISNEVHSVTNINVAGEHTDFIQMFEWGTNVLVEANYVHDCVMQLGNIEFGFNGGTTNSTRNLTIRNNVFSRISGPLFVGVPNTLIYNNVFYKVGTAANQPVLWYEDSTHTSMGGEVINNVFLMCGSAPQNNWVGGIGGVGIDLGLVVVSNNYFAGTLYAAKDDSPGQAYIGDAAVNGGDPKFVNEAADNFHLQADSPLVGVGLALTATFNTDKDNVTRTGTWDIGAYEYVAAVTNGNSATVGTLTIY